MKASYFLLFNICLLHISIRAQSTFQLSISGINFGQSLETSSGDIVATGWNLGESTSTFPPIYSNQGMALVKINEDGDTLWSRIFSVMPDNEFSISHTLAIASDGGYIIAGGCYECDITGFHIIIIRTDPEGDTIWAKKYFSELPNGRIRSITKKLNGNFLAVGEIGFPSSANGMILEFNEDGEILWSKRIESDNFVQLFSVIHNVDSSFVTIGSVANGKDHDMIIGKFNSWGESVWIRTFGGPEQDIGFDVCHSHSEGFVVTGGIRSMGSGSMDAIIMEIDQNGTPLWSNLLGSTQGDYGQTILAVDDGYIIGGNSNALKSESTYLLFKTDRSGVFQWAKILPSQYGTCFDLMEMSNNRVLASGQEFELVTMDLQGNSGCPFVNLSLNQLDLFPQETDWSIELHDISFQQGSPGMKVVKGIGDPDICRTVNSEEIDNLENISVINNLADDQILIKVFSMGEIKVRLFDQMGHLIVNQKFESGNSLHEVNTPSLPPGVYFAEISSAESRLVEKLFKS